MREPLPHQGLRVRRHQQHSGGRPVRRRRRRAAARAMHPRVRHFQRDGTQPVAAPCFGNEEKASCRPCSPPGTKISAIIQVLSCCGAIKPLSVLYAGHQYRRIVDLVRRRCDCALLADSLCCAGLRLPVRLPFSHSFQIICTGVALFASGLQRGSSRSAR